MTVALLMLLVSAQARVEDAPGAAISTDRIIGHWDSGSRAFWEMRLDVNKTGVDIGRCRHVAYSIIQSRVGIGTGSVPPARWRFCGKLADYSCRATSERHETDAVSNEVGVSHIGVFDSSIQRLSR